MIDVAFFYGNGLNVFDVFKTDIKSIGRWKPIVKLKSNAVYKYLPYCWVTAKMVIKVGIPFSI